MDRQVYRNESYATLIYVIAVLFASLSVAAAILRDESGIGVAERWLPVLPVLALAAFCALRMARAGVYPEGDGVRIVNPLTTKRIPWARIRRFSLRRHKGFSALGFAELVDGTEVELWGVQARSSSVIARRVPEELVAALNERLEAQRAASGGS